MPKPSTQIPGSLGTKSPGTESNNKWKIPHYYKRLSTSSNTNLQPCGSNSFSPVANNNASQMSPAVENINRSPSYRNMVSPKKMILEDNNRKASRSKKNGKNMVFVNYTVQEDNKNQQNNNNDNNNFMNKQQQVVPTEFIPPVVPHVKPTAKQKSARKRMLKIFGSSKDSSKSVSKPTPLNRSISTPTLTSEEMVMPSSKPQKTATPSKRSYGSILKYGKLRSTSSASISTSSKSNTAVNTSFDDMMNEVVPISTNTKHTSYSNYSNLSQSYLNEPQMNVNVANIPLFNSSKLQNINQDAKLDISLKQQQQNLKEFNFKNSPIIMNNSNNNRSVASLSSISDTKFQPTTVSPASNNTVGISPSAELPMLNTHEENDASVAFSKMFTKKRPSITDSMSSARSPNQTNTTAKPNSVSSAMVSMTNTFSPMRTVSPARPRSSTRGSSSYRLSRDFSALSNVADGPETNVLNNDSYLDTQFVQKMVPNSSSNAHRVGHRNKQDSVSDLYRQQQLQQQQQILTSNSTSNGFPATSPYFTPSFTMPISTPTSSTPSAGDINQSKYFNANVGNTSVNSNGYLDMSTSNDTGNNTLVELSDTPTPLSDMPAVQGIPRDSPINSVSPNISIKNSSKMKQKMIPTKFNDGIEILQVLPNVRSTSSSSAMDSVMTNSISTTSSYTMTGINPDNVTLQNVNNEKLTLVNTGLGLSDVNLNHFASDNQQQQSQQMKNNNVNPTLTSNNNHNSSFADDQLVQQMYMEFDFENPSSFFHEQSKILNPGQQQPHNMGVVQHSPALTSVAPTSISSPSTIVSPNHLFNNHIDNSNVTMMNNNNNMDNQYSNFDNSISFNNINTNGNINGNNDNDNLNTSFY